ncbi:MAG: PLP-dependent aminotransferase family protein [Phycicoccus sp.]|nr:PLP-dependent aminotransferase family protein [Phycicoccus sp.]
MPRPAPSIDLTLGLRESSAPLRQRIADAVVQEIREGRLAPGDPLPSSRALAADLAVSRGSTVAAYDELAAAGFVIARPGSGVVVAPDADLAARAGAASHVLPATPPKTPQLRPSGEQLRWDLRPGQPDPALIDRTAWRRAWRAAATAVFDGPAWRPDHLRLREQLAQLVRRTRGISTTAEEVLVVPGVGALTHVLPAVIDLGGRRFGLEDPGYVEAWSALQTAGVPTRSLPVDDDGLDPTALGADLGAVYVTPAHQYPLGARMPVGRRAELLAWAHRHQGLVVEDDYDGEFRYGVAPLPALRSLPEAAERVVYIGTASKLLDPGLRVAWVIAPEPVRSRLAVELARRSLVVPDIVGEALATFLESGAWTAHHARAARTYAARRAALVTALGEHLPDVPLAGVDAGLHLVARLPDDADDVAACDALARAGVAVAPLTAYAIEATSRGLVLCYAGLPETAASQVARLIARTFAHRVS